MAKPQMKQNLNEESSSLKGTLAAVFIVGAFLVISWLAIFGLYLNRL
ncbi:cytochrome c oxidase subunit 2A [Heyndrickxia sp. NPDC080065]